MKKIGIETYEKYVGEKYKRDKVLEYIVKRFEIKKAIYPGSYIHIMPSIFIPEVLYIDVDKKAKSFFESIEEINDYIKANKQYEGEFLVSFIAADYNTSMEIEKESYDKDFEFIGALIMKGPKYSKNAEHYLFKKLSSGGLVNINPND